jgi:hypothetical protein
MGMARVVKAHFKHLRKKSDGNKDPEKIAEDAKKGVVGQRHRQFTGISEAARLFNDMLKTVRNGIHFFQS